LSPRLRSTSAILAAFFLPLGLYLASLHGSVSFWDTADLQTVPYILGIPYPTGFPGYVLAGWVWSHLFALGPVAWRMNVLAALAAAGTVAALAALLDALDVPPPVALVAAWCYAFAGTVWQHATYVDVHPLAFCAAAWSAAFAVRWSRDGVARDGIACVAGAALAFACDNATVLTLPGIALLALVRRPSPRAGAALALGGLAGALLPYVYLPLRSAAVTAARIDPTLALGLPPGRPFWDDGHPASWAGFVRVVTGSDFAPHQALAGLLGMRAVHGVVADFGPLAAHDLGAPLPWLALFGGLVLWWRQSFALAGLLVLGGLPLLFASAYTVESDATRYYPPAYFALTAGAAYGVGALDAATRGVVRYALLAVIGIAAVALLVNDGIAAAPLFAQPFDRSGPLWIERVIARTPADAIVVAPWNEATTLAYGSYVLHALGRRIVVTAGAREDQAHYRTWLRTRPLVVVSDEAMLFPGFRVTELDEGEPHLYALR